MTGPRWTEVDGVPVVWSPLPGPVRALLAFRVGEADETAATHGITHLTEHLALHGMHERPYELNGMVELGRTAFGCAGTADDAADFVARVCAGLAEPPAERVVTERAVLRAEGRQARPTYREAMLSTRYGARGYGLPGFQHFGLYALDAGDVRDWAATRFTRGNAVLSLTGPPPAGLRIPLPDGPRRPPVAAEPLDRTMPAWFAKPATGAALSVVVPRTTPGLAAAAIVSAELTRRLRFELGLTYSVESLHDPLGADHVHVTFSADPGDDDRARRLRDELLAVVGGLVDEGPSQAVLERLREGRLRATADEIGIARNHLDRVALSRLNGRPDDLHAALRDLAGTGLLLVPADMEPPLTAFGTRFHAIPPWSPPPVEGTEYAPAIRSQGTARLRLVCGGAGVSVTGSTSTVSVAWRDAVLVGAWDGGARLLVSGDGHSMLVVPDDWRDGAAAVAAIDAAVPPEVVVPLGAGGPAPRIQRPPRGRLVSSRVLAVLGAICVTIAFLAAGVAASGPQPATGSRAATTPDDISALWFFATVMFGAGCAAGGVLMYRTRGGGRTERRSLPS